MAKQATPMNTTLARYSDAYREEALPSLSERALPLPPVS